MLTHETGRSLAHPPPDDLVSRPTSVTLKSILGDHFFEDDSHRLAIRRHLAAGVLPLKFAYAGSAARTHAELARSAGYQSVIGTVDLEVACLAVAEQRHRLPRSIAEIGPGNGVHTLALLDALGEQSWQAGPGLQYGLGWQCERYTALDFSSTLLTMASRHIRPGLDPRTRFAAAQWDMESGSSTILATIRRGCGPLLVCLLGNTIGNVEDAAGVVRDIGAALGPDDILLLGVALESQQSPQERLAPYQSEVFRRAALEPLRWAGVEPDDVDFRLRWENGAVVGHAVFRRATFVGDTVLPAEHAVRCFSSRRFRPEGVLRLFDPSRWRTLSAAVNEAADHLVVAVSPRGGSHP